MKISDLKRKGKKITRPIDKTQLMLRNLTCLVSQQQACEAVILEAIQPFGWMTAATFNKCTQYYTSHLLCNSTPEL